MKKASNISPNDIWNISSEQEFNAKCLEIFRYQYKTVDTYQTFCQLVDRIPENVKSVNDIPFLPIEFFKSHKILSKGKQADIVFTSSGTSGQATSKHHVADLNVYEDSFTNAFKQLIGDPKHIAFCCLLPSYMEREGSSLIYMAEKLVGMSHHPESGFFLYDHVSLYDQLADLKQENIPTVLLGVSFALLDFVEAHQIDFPDLIVMETGGMKGRRKEITRDVLHDLLKSGFGVDGVYSEYGMTELLSQAYSRGDGIFRCPPWMRVMIRDNTDPFSFLGHDRLGGINIIDLANIHSCAFIATSDLGKTCNDGFEILGRIDNSDIRGCNLMVSNL